MDVPILNLLEEPTAFPHQPANWQGIAKDLAEEFSCPIHEVEQILSTETHQLEQRAHIKVFVPLLAIKQVKDLLRLNRHAPPRHEQLDLHHPQPSRQQPGP